MASDQFTRFVILISSTQPTIEPSLIQDHIAFLERLDNEGKLELCGPFLDYKGGMIILKVATKEEAEAIAASDPFVRKGGKTFEVRAWQLACEGNDYLRN